MSEGEPKYIPTTEQELLTDEIREKIMSKVMDIHTPGIAYTIIRLYALANILKEGLLGWPASGHYKDERTKEIWAQDTREQRNTIVNFNIVGRAVDAVSMVHPESFKPISQELEVGYTFWSSHAGEHPILLFDISSFKEGDPISDKNIASNEQRRSHMYRAEMDGREVRGKDGKIIPHSEYGFTLSYRVAPRFFTGIVVPEFYIGRELNEIGDKEEVARLVTEMQQTVIKKYVSKMQEIGIFLPIYSKYTNDLLWPEYISYSQLKRKIVKK